MSSFNVEKFPTSPTAQKMMRRISPIYGQAYTAKWLFQVMGLELDETWRILRELRDQEFPETVTWAIEFWEHKFSIVPNRSLTLEERRARLKRKMLPRFPLSPGQFEKLIKEAFDLIVDIDETYGPGIFKMTIRGNREKGFEPLPLYRYIYDTKPSHLSTLVELIEEIEGNIYIGIGTTKLKRQHILMSVMQDTEADEVRSVGIANGFHRKAHVLMSVMQDTKTEDMRFIGIRNESYKRQHPLMAVMENTTARKENLIGGIVVKHKKITLPMGVDLLAEYGKIGIAVTQHRRYNLKRSVPLPETSKSAALALSELKKHTIPVGIDLAPEQETAGVALTQHRKVEIKF